MCETKAAASDSLAFEINPAVYLFVYKYESLQLEVVT